MDKESAIENMRKQFEDMTAEDFAQTWNKYDADGMYLDWFKFILQLCLLKGSLSIIDNSISMVFRSGLIFTLLIFCR